MSTNNQKARIHILKDMIQLKDAEYRDILRYNFGVDSSRDLQVDQAAILIEILETKLFKTKGNSGGFGYYQHNGKLKFEELADRPGMARPIQLRLIDALWAQVTWASDEVSKDKALRSFLEKKFGISDMRFVEYDDVFKIVPALKAMKRQKEQKEQEKRNV